MQNDTLSVYVHVSLNGFMHEQSRNAANAAVMDGVGSHPVIYAIQISKLSFLRHLF